MKKGQKLKTARLPGRPHFQTGPIHTALPERLAEFIETKTVGSHEFFGTHLTEKSTRELCVCRATTVSLAKIIIRLREPLTPASLPALRELRGDVDASSSVVHCEKAFLTSLRKLSEIEYQMWNRRTMFVIPKVKWEGK